MEINFLQNNWGTIKPTETYGVDDDVVAGGFLRPWNHDVGCMRGICRALEILQPEIVIELGTFEGLGTIRMAEALQKLNKKIDFYTIDVGEAPVNSLGSPYGVPQKFDENGDLIYTTVPWEDFKERRRGTLQESQGWGSWDKVMSNRDKRLKNGFGRVNLQFVKGFSFDVLPGLLEKIGRWDFCFQDTLHYKEDIIKEWVLLKPYSVIGSVIVFDDMYRPHNRGWVDWFAENEPDWETRWSEFGHQSLWAERIK